MMVPLLVLLFLTSIQASAQTLMGISVDNSPSQSLVEAESIFISAGGTDPAGGTTYVEVEVVTKYIVMGPSGTTLTALSAPTTYTETFVNDASGRHNIVSDGSTAYVQQSCGFGANGRGTCIDIIPGPKTTQTLTVSGDVVPFYTLGATPTSSQSSAERTITPSIILTSCIVFESCPRGLPQLEAGLAYGSRSEQKKIVILLPRIADQAGQEAGTRTEWKIRGYSNDHHHIDIVCLVKNCPLVAQLVCVQTRFFGASTNLGI
ncbi:hypothetical protein DFH06DRAFT_1121971 [Mycena polygramma]|nr:hypothetical protein DFH06DRAFT_1121971 [Mycena polygramma]